MKNLILIVLICFTTNVFSQHGILITNSTNCDFNVDLSGQNLNCTSQFLQSYLVPANSSVKAMAPAGSRFLNANGVSAPCGLVVSPVPAPFFNHTFSIGASNCPVLPCFGVLPASTAVSYLPGSCCGPTVQATWNGCDLITIRN